MANPTMTFKQYSRLSQKTDLSSGKHALSTAVIGFAGEVGDLLTILKKQERGEPDANMTTKIKEEVGDCLWYLFKLSREANVNLWSLLSLDPSYSLNRVSKLVVRPNDTLVIGMKLVGLAGKMADEAQVATPDFRKSLIEAMQCLALVADRFDFKLATAAKANVEKTKGFFLDTISNKRNFDDGFPQHERLPVTLKVVFKEVTSGEKKSSLMYINGLRYGSPLTDNATTQDDYRFHDVFHLAYLANLGWSPVIRALLRVKRKSDPKVDEVQDGARAILIEEGISHLVFRYAQQNNFLKQGNRVNISILKTIQMMISDLEVSERPMWMWQKAIQDGFDIFRKLRHHRRGQIIVNRQASSITFARATAEFGS